MRRRLRDGTLLLGLRDHVLVRARLWFATQISIGRRQDITQGMRKASILPTMLRVRRAGLQYVLAGAAVELVNAVLRTWS